MDPFPSTNWSLVLAAGRPESPSARAALEALCRAYWVPLHTYVRRRVADRHEAQDLTQEFFTRLLEKNYVGEACRDRGRFRAFLLTALKHFLSHEWDKARAKKRGGGRVMLPLEFPADSGWDVVEPVDDGLTPEQCYHRKWAVTLLDHVLKRLRDELAAEGRVAHFESLKPFLLGERERSTYADAAGALGISEEAARMAVHRLRRRYRELLRDEVARTVAEPGNVEDEIQSLFAAFAPK